MSYAALLDNIRTKAPGALDAEIELEIFNTIDELHRTETLPIAAPSGATPSAWLTSGEYADYQHLLIDGVLARMLGQIGKPYANVELATVHFQLYRAESERRRAQKAAARATTTTTLAPDRRLVSDMLQQLPGARESEVETVLFNVIEEMVFTDLPVAAPSQGDPPADWLTPQQYADFAPILRAGVLAYMLVQAGKPYAQPELGAAQLQRYRDLLWRARQDVIANETAGAITSQLIDTLRMELPGVRDGTITMALFAVVDELCRTAKIYRQEIEIPLVEGQRDYVIAPANRSVVTTYFIAHEALDVSGATLDLVDARIVLASAPTADDAIEPLVLDVALVPQPGVADLADWLPATLWERYYQCFLHGVLSRLMMQPAKPYSNQALARYHGQRLRHHMALARVDASQGGAPAAQMWRFPRFGM